MVAFIYLGFEDVADLNPPLCGVSVRPRPFQRLLNRFLSNRLDKLSREHVAYVCHVLFKGES